MDFKLAGIGGDSAEETVVMIRGGTLSDARTAAAELLLAHPDLEGVEIFDRRRFVEFVARPG
jgi:hypothetical protein